jgi:hypothetical protein
MNFGWHFETIAQSILRNLNTQTSELFYRKYKFQELQMKFFDVDSHNCLFSPSPSMLKVWWGSGALTLKKLPEMYISAQCQSLLISICLIEL